MPTSKQVMGVINSFKKVEFQAKKRTILDRIFGRNKMVPSKVDMTKGYVAYTTNHGCAACHGAWYAKAIGLGKWADFSDGEYAMCRALGLDMLAGNIDRWIYSLNAGLRSTYALFGGHADAFYHPVKRPKGAQTVTDIIGFWQDVYDIVRKKELLEKIARVDVTEDLASMPIVEERADIKELVEA